VTKKLVIDGKRLEYAGFTPVNFDGDRIPLPSRFVEYAHLEGSAAAECWLLVVTAGRYRLVPSPTKASAESSSLMRVLREWEDVATNGDVLAGTASNEHAAVRARIIPTVASPMGTGWRITLPKEAKALVPAGEDRSFVFVLVVAGFIEIWFPDTLRRAVSVPIADLLS
jgi:hypothetical protein